MGGAYGSAARRLGGLGLRRVCWRRHGDAATTGLLIALEWRRPLAGQAPHCAVTYFKGEPLVRRSRRVPLCDGCPEGKTLTFDHCKNSATATATADSDRLVAAARRRAASGGIDPLHHLAERRVFLFRGTRDEVYAESTVNTTFAFARQLMPPQRVNT